MSFAKLLWLNLSLSWILLGHIEKKKGIQWRGSGALLGTEDPPHIPPAGAGAALSLLLLRVLHQVPGRLWRGGAHSSAQFPFLSILGKKGQCRFWKGKSRALHRQCLGSPPATSGHRSHPGDTDWDKNKLLGLFRAVVQQLMRHLTAVEGKCNEIQQQRRVGCV